MSDYTLVQDDEVPDNVIIPEDGWALKINKVIVGINSMKMAEESNEDGSIDCDIDYDVLNYDDLEDGDIPDDFGDIIGKSVISMLEDAMNVRDMKEAIKEVDDARNSK